jgi:short chain dehydrogenase
MDRLKGKRALITGCTSGIGLETARQFIAEGARVAITARDANICEQVRQQLGEQAVCIVSDAADVTSQKKLANKIERHLASSTSSSSMPALQTGSPSGSGAKQRLTVPSSSMYAVRSFSFRHCCPSLRIQLPSFSTPLSTPTSECRYERVRGFQSCFAVDGTQSVGGADLARRSSQCCQPRANRNPSVQQTRTVCSRSKGNIGVVAESGSSEAVRQSFRDRERCRLSRIR